VRSLLGGIAASVSNRANSGASATTYNGARAGVASLFGPNATGAQTQMSAYGAVSTLYAIVGRIAYSTSEVRWRLFRKRTDARRTLAHEDENDRTELAVHPALDLWNKPNPFYTCQQFTETVQQHQDLTGEQWWIISRNPASPMPLELWPVRPDRMTPVAHPTDFIVGYVYTDAQNVQTWYDVNEVIHIKAPNPMDPYRGLGVVQSLLVDLDAGKAAAEWNRNFFGNNASPGGVIEFDKRLSDTEFDEFAARWRENHRGTGNAHRVAMMDNGGKWKDAQLNMRDMQFAELRGLSREIVREAFGMHGHMLGLSEDINRANAEAAEDVFARWMLNPRLNRIKQALNTQLLPLFGTSGEGLEFDYDDPALEDSEGENARLTARTTAFKTLTDAGAEWDSALEAVGLPPIEKAPEPKVLPGDPGAPGTTPKKEEAA
jgi:HK97 family phage portal protein